MHFISASLTDNDGSLSLARSEREQEQEQEYHDSTRVICLRGQSLKRQVGRGYAMTV